MNEGAMTKLTARIHAEDGSYWVDVPDLPGVFATGDTLDELFDSLSEGVVLVMGNDSGTDSVQLERAVISIG